MPLVKSLVGHRTAVVKLEERTFVVYFNGADEAVRIIERKRYGSFPIDGFYNAVYWSAKNHKLGAEWTLPRRIIAAAREKLNAAAP